MIVKISNDENYLDWKAKGTDRIIQNVRNILRTKKYEVPFLRNMGVNPNFIDASIHSIKASIQDDVTTAIETYEPRVKVLSVTVEDYDVNGHIAISVEVEV